MMQVRPEIGFAGIIEPGAALPSRSSKAEHSPDKRETAERYRAGRPGM